MGKLFEKQAIYIKLTMGLDITGATRHVIKYIRPDKSTGEFAASIKTPSNGVLEYNVNVDGSDVSSFGDWILWPFVTLSDGQNIPGEAVIMKIYKEGT